MVVPSSKRVSVSPDIFLREWQIQHFRDASVSLGYYKNLKMKKTRACNFLKSTIVTKAPIFYYFHKIS